jgi:alpha-beta hydrolase superfamily lysophospholipase
VPLTRRTLLGLVSGCALAPLAGLRAARAAESPITLVTPTGSIFGTLALPDGAQPNAVVLIIAGSGPTDRDGNSAMGIKSDCYKLLAIALASKGIASVRYDKRGIAASAAAMKNEADLRFEDYADDAAGWVRMLSGTGDALSAPSRVFARVIVAGHSEGSLIGMLAAQKSKTAAYVSLCGPGRPADKVVHDQIAAQAPPAMLAQIDPWLAQLKAGKVVPDAPSTGPLAALFRPSVQPYLISWFKYDPAAEIGKLRIPITLVGGTADVQVPPSEAQILKAAAPSAKLVIVDGMAHTLKHIAGTTQADEIPAYTDPSLPIVPEVPAAIAAIAS